MIKSKELIVYTKNLSVLFAEDHNELRKNTADILKNFFNNVETAVDGQDAVAKYKEYYNNNSKYYDIVITDIQMPKLNGIDVTQQIYSINSNQTIIILSAYDDSCYLLPLINMGIEQFIKKPIDYQEFLRVLLNTSKKIVNKSATTVADPLVKVKLSETFVYDRHNNALFDGNENIYLTKYEIIFMQLLTTNVGKIYANSDIASNYLSHNENLDTQNIRKLLSKLRKKLPKNILESIYGVGYRIVPYFEE